MYSFFKKVREAIKFDCGSIVCTVNSFTSNELKLYDTSNGDDYNSDKRYKVVIDSFPKYIKGDFIKATKQLLKGEFGFMCQYDYDPDFETIWSSIFDLKSLIIYRAEGDPRKKEFITDTRLNNIKFGR